MMEIRVTIFVNFDGLCRNYNKGKSAFYSFVAKDETGKMLGHKQGLAAEQLSEDATANMAEYRAVIEAMKWMVEKGYTDKEVMVRGDSQLVIKQINGEYRVKAARIKPLYNEAIVLMSRFKNIKFEWIRREENYEADRWTKAAADEAERFQAMISSSKRRRKRVDE